MTAQGRGKREDADRLVASGLEKAPKLMPKRCIRVRSESRLDRSRPVCVLQP